MSISLGPKQTVLLAGQARPAGTFPEPPSHTWTLGNASDAGELVLLHSGSGSGKLTLARQLMVPWREALIIGMFWISIGTEKMSFWLQARMTHSSQPDPHYPFFYPSHTFHDAKPWPFKGLRSLHAAVGRTAKVQGITHDFEDVWNGRRCHDTSGKLGQSNSPKTLNKKGRNRCHHGHQDGNTKCLQKCSKTEASCCREG